MAARNPPPAFPSSTATPLEREFYGTPDDGRVHVLIKRPGAVIRVAIPINGPTTMREVMDRARKEFS